MPNYSRPDSTPADGPGEGRWAIPILPLRVNGAPLQLVGDRPTWHWTIHYTAFAGVTRMELPSLHAPSITTCIMAYVACLALATVTGRLVQYLKADRTPRIFSTILGMAGFTLACLQNHPASRQKPTHLLVELVVPLVGAGLAFAVNLAGEALATWFPAPERDGNQALRIRRARNRPGYRPEPA
jgi:hypothetical protein